MRDTGLPYTIHTPSGDSVTIGVPGFRLGGPDDVGGIERAANAEPLVYGRGLADGSVHGRTVTPGLAYLIRVYAHDTDAQARMSRESNLARVMYELRDGGGRIEWTEHTGETRELLDVTTTQVPVITEHIAPNGHVWEFEVQSERDHIVGELFEAQGEGLDLSGGGLTFPASFPWEFESSGGGIATIPTLGGERPAWPVLTVRAPIVNPRIRLVGTPYRIRLDQAGGLNLGNGDTIVVDTWNASVLRDGVTDARAHLDESLSTFFQIPAAGAEIALSGSSFGAAARVDVAVRRTYNG